MGGVFTKLIPRNTDSLHLKGWHLTISPQQIWDAVQRHNTGGHNALMARESGADCLSKWVGEAECQLRLLFEEAQNCQLSIIFFDEIDGLAPVQSSKQDQIHALIISTLLALMDSMDGHENIKGLAKFTKGYGGADLRSSDRLLLKPETIGVTFRDFMISIKKLIPSSRARPIICTLKSVVPPSNLSHADSSRYPPFADHQSVDPPSSTSRAAQSHCPPFAHTLQHQFMSQSHIANVYSNMHITNLPPRH
ncbi:uncharacterized protein HD556DRAFT_1313417 [Suillus plorans]|uniref:ATPase AAA-type core domain-containing protein n=1 Tax=Suillus plorans TaxID=116603 RepID=A0A9P7ACL7_9AGAM|nr:uncharacterized protein HD556DRAFT_1313417 [Suillus plorans]KAG1786534.1 hypothetical protein HD556DRAFT_1313417 [Suillus plorans]